MERMDSQIRQDLYHLGILDDDGSVLLRNWDKSQIDRLDSLSEKALIAATTKALENDGQFHETSMYAAAICHLGKSGTLSNALMKLLLQIQQKHGYSTTIPDGTTIFSYKKQQNHLLKLIKLATVRMLDATSLPRELMASILVGNKLTDADSEMLLRDGSSAYFQSVAALLLKYAVDNVTSVAAQWACSCVALAAERLLSTTVQSEASHLAKWLLASCRETPLLIKAVLPTIGLVLGSAIPRHYTAPTRRALLDIVASVRGESRSLNEIMYSYAQDTDATIRAQLCRHIAADKPHHVTRTLCQLCRDGSKLVRESAFRALTAHKLSLDNDMIRSTAVPSAMSQLSLKPGTDQYGHDVVEAAAAWLNSVWQHDDEMSMMLIRAMVSRGEVGPVGDVLCKDMKDDDWIKLCASCTKRELETVGHVVKGRDMRNTTILASTLLSGEVEGVPEDRLLGSAAWLWAIAEDSSTHVQEALRRVLHKDMIPQHRICLQALLRTTTPCDWIQEYTSSRLYDLACEMPDIAVALAFSSRLQAPRTLMQRLIEDVLADIGSDWASLQGLAVLVCEAMVWSSRETLAASFAHARQTPGTEEEIQAMALERAAEEQSRLPNSTRHMEWLMKLARDENAPASARSAAVLALGRLASLHEMPLDAVKDTLIASLSEAPSAVTWNAVTVLAELVSVQPKWETSAVLLDHFDTLTDTLKTHTLSLLGYLVLRRVLKSEDVTTTMAMRVGRDAIAREFFERWIDAQPKPQRQSHLLSIVHQIVTDKAHSQRERRHAAVAVLAITPVPSADVSSWFLKATRTSTPEELTDLLHVALSVRPTPAGITELHKSVLEQPRLTKSKRHVRAWLQEAEKKKIKVADELLDLFN